MPCYNTAGTRIDYCVLHVQWVGLFFEITEILPLVGILEKTPRNTFPWHYPALLCGYLVTSLLIASSACYWPAFMHPPPILRGQRSHAYLMSFNGRILYLARRGTEHSVKWCLLLYIKIP